MNATKRTEVEVLDEADAADLLRLPIAELRRLGAMGQLTGGVIRVGDTYVGTLEAVARLRGLRAGTPAHVVHADEVAEDARRATAWARMEREAIEAGRAADRKARAEAEAEAKRQAEITERNRKAHEQAHKRAVEAAGLTKWA